MNNVTFPLKPQMQGPNVADLQAALQQLLERGAVLRDDERTRRELASALRREHEAQTFGEASRKVVALFQKARRIDDSGVVDSATADALNGLLREWGLLDVPDGIAARDGTRVLHTQLRALGYTVPSHEVEEGRAGIGTRAALFQLQAALRLPVTGVLDAPTSAALDQALIVARQGHRLEGRIFFEDGTPAAGLALRVYDRGLHGAATRLGETKTDAQGYYSLPYKPQRGRANIEVRMALGRREVSLSRVRFDTAPSGVMNLVAPVRFATGRRSELERLSAALSPHVGNMEALADIREDEEQQDLAFLHQATGWDARVIALAATAEATAARTGLARPVAYALLRSGLPSDPARLARLTPTIVGKTLRKAVAAGIVSMDEAQITSAKTAFTKFARDTRRAGRLRGAVSTVGELLERSGLAANQQIAFEELQATHRGPGNELWKKARALGIPGAGIKRLQLQGKLAHLTLNNAELVDNLIGTIETPDAVDRLVDEDLDKPERWAARLTTLANGSADALARLIPEAYPGETTEARLLAYAADLARKVRVGFPTQVVTRMLERDEIPLEPAAAPLRSPAVTFLKNASRLGFELGRVPLGRFVADNRDALFDGIAQNESAGTLEVVKKVQRLYQITPSNESLQVLLKRGLNSAHEIAKLDEATFLARHGEFFPSLIEARAVHRKAQVVSAVVSNFFTGTQIIKSTPGLYATSPAPADAEAARQAASDALTRQFPTLETLFGPLDFCECQHCGSVLSPAAYLVDILKFLDPDAGTWTHEGQPTPYEVLVQRRPDLPHLPLTCENTHTAMPYIDIVNEILEFAVVHGKLSQGAVHDTGPAKTPELLAEPAHVIATAYEVLATQRYPLSLPFDLGLETVRHFLRHFECSLTELLETFRLTDELLSDPADANAYGRRAIAAESLGISPAEYALFTNADPLANWFTYYGYNDGDTALGELSSARTLSRRLGVSFKELVDLVRTRFVNPRLASLVLLRKLGLETHDVYRYKGHPSYTPFNAAEKAAFESVLATASARYGDFDVKARLDEMWDAGELNAILVLASPDGECSFEKTKFQYATGTPALGYDYVRFNVFVRLWRKLGWSIEETDQALNALLPSNANPPAASNLGAALADVLLYIATVAELHSRLKTGKNGRVKLLTFWSSLPTSGTAPLYEQLFLTRGPLSAQKSGDAVFDDPLGEYLTDPSVRLGDHLLAVQSALNLTADEVRRILIGAGQSLEGTGTLAPAPLTLDSVSLLYRHALLAKGLKLSIDELLALRALTGRDPFRRPEASPITDAKHDHPRQQTLRFLDEVAAVEQSGLDVGVLDYVIRHTSNPGSPAGTDPSTLVSIYRTLNSGLRQIAIETAVPEDAGQLDDEFFRQRLGLVLPAEVVDTFFAMWTGTIQYEKTAQGVDPDDQLDPDAFVDTTRIRVHHNGVNRQQTLVFRGVLLDPKREQILHDHGPSNLLETLLDAIQAEAKTYFERFLREVLKPPAGVAEGPWLADLFGPEPADLTDSQRRLSLARAFLPNLQETLGKRFVVQTLAAASGSEPDLVEALLLDAMVLHEPESTAPLVGAFLAAKDFGVTGAFFDAADPSAGGAAATHLLVQTADTSIRAGAHGSAHFSGYLEVPQSGPYRFFAVLGDSAARVELRLGHLPEPLLWGSVAAGEATVDDYTELRAGVPYRFSVTFSHLAGTPARLEVQGEGLPRGSLSQLVLLPNGSVQRASLAYLLLEKALLVADGLSLEPRVVRYIADHPDDFQGFRWSDLPTRGGNDAAAAAPGLFAGLLGVIDLVLLGNELGVTTGELVGILEQARRTYPAGTTQQEVTESFHGTLGKLMRTDAVSVGTATERLGFTSSLTAGGDRVQIEFPDLARASGVRRLWQAVQLARKLGASMPDVIRWATPTPTLATAQDLRDTVKARYETETWQRVAQGIFDKLRRLRRDALVAHLLHRDAKQYDTLERLYEHFLIDPGMEPVVQTSRLRLAISSVQLFVQRCLLNLEPQVRPDALRAAHWEWMKRYRIWEANRKIFLYPENWLEPEFRDDKSFLFQELEGSLLQGDVSDELAEDAIFTYLEQLEELARLDIVTMYCQEDDAFPEANTLHVFGRTSVEPRKYFYRRCANRMWTPWEPVNAEIEGHHVVAAVWRQRLHLFWLTFPESAKDEPARDVTLGEMAEQSASDSRPIRLVQVQLHWSAYLDGQWSPRQSGPPTTPIEAWPRFDASRLFIHVETERDAEGTEGPLYIHVTGHYSRLEIMPQQVPERNDHAMLSKAFRLVSKNSPPAWVEGSWPDDHPYSFTETRYGRYAGAGALSVAYAIETTEVHEGDASYSLQPHHFDGFGSPSPWKTILEEGYSEHEQAYELVTRSNPVGGLDANIARYRSPFFYQNARHTFFVEPWFTEVTVKEYDQWAPTPDPGGVDDGLLDDLEVIPIPDPPVPVEVTDGRRGPPRWTDPIDEDAIFDIRTRGDWLTNPATQILYGDIAVGNQGRVAREVTTEGRNRATSMAPDADRSVMAALLKRMGIASPLTTVSATAKQPILAVGTSGLTYSQALVLGSTSTGAPGRGSIES